MVTHNPELAEEYSSRIIKLLDGKVTDDSNPYDSKTDATIEEAMDTINEVELEETIKYTKKENGKVVETVKQTKSSIKKGTASKTKKTSMSFLTALSLSFKNLLTKKARTFMVSSVLSGSLKLRGTKSWLSAFASFKSSM